MTTTITLTIDEDLEDDLKDALRFILFARRSDLRGPIDFKTDEALHMAVLVAIQTASELTRSITENADNCGHVINDFLGHDPFFNDEGEYEDREEIARKLGLSIRPVPPRPPKRRIRAKRKARTRGGRVLRV